MPVDILAFAEVRLAELGLIYIYIKKWLFSCHTVGDEKDVLVLPWMTRPSNVSWLLSTSANAVARKRGH